MSPYGLYEPHEAKWFWMIQPNQEIGFGFMKKINSGWTAYGHRYGPPYGSPMRGLEREKIIGDRRVRVENKFFF